VPEEYQLVLRIADGTLLAFSLRGSIGCGGVLQGVALRRIAGSSAVSRLRAQLHCREIRSADLDGILTLLRKGFPERPREYFVRALMRLTEHATPPGVPRYGYLMENHGAPVGVNLVIFSSIAGPDDTAIRGNVSSWYVEPAFRMYAPMLMSRTLSHANVTLLNVSPARHTWPILEKRGYRQFCGGQFIAVSRLAGRFFDVQVRSVSRELCAGDDLSPSEIALLLAHARYGCLSVTCNTVSGRTPFVFARGWFPWKAFQVPCAVLAYCRDVEDFVRFAGPLGRYFASHGVALVSIDSNGPIPGLRGRFVDWAPRFFRGPHQPRLGDLSYSELVMFGL